MLRLIDRVPIDPDPGKTPRAEDNSDSIGPLSQKPGDIETVVIHCLIIVGDSRRKDLRPTNFMAIDISLVQSKATDMHLRLSDLFTRLEFSAKIPRRKRDVPCTHIFWRINPYPRSFPPGLRFPDHNPARFGGLSSDYGFTCQRIEPHPAITVRSPVTIRQMKGHIDGIFSRNYLNIKMIALIHRNR